MIRWWQKSVKVALEGDFRKFMSLNKRRKKWKMRLLRVRFIINKLTTIWWSQSPQLPMLLQNRVRSQHRPKSTGQRGRARLQPQRLQQQIPRLRHGHRHLQYAWLTATVTRRILGVPWSMMAAGPESRIDSNSEAWERWLVDCLRLTQLPILSCSFSTIAEWNTGRNCYCAGCWK